MSIIGLIAQHSRLDHLAGNMSSSFRNRSSANQFSGEQVLYGVIGLLVAGVVVWAFVRLAGWMKRRILQSPQWLFWKLCAAHQLRWRHCLLLWRMARIHRLKDPARMFLEPELLMLPGSQLRLLGSAAAMVELEQILFREPEPIASESDSAPRAETLESPPPAASSMPLFAGVPAPQLDLPAWSVTPPAQTVE